MGLEIELDFAKNPKHNALVAKEGGGRGATVRYEDEKGIDVNDTLVCLDAETGEEFMRARVVHVTKVPVWRALDIIEANKAVYTTKYVYILHWLLNRYYEDVRITDKVKVIIYRPL